ncbi:hypothetical protein A8F94_15880 [Bacillus sp. FJAT-27225]|nr:hypothetical protein A8F94_15880 [Bacillus sp. FJAT-27225]
MSVGLWLTVPAKKNAKFITRPKNCQTAEHQAKSYKQFPPRDKNVEQIDVWKSYALQEVYIPLVNNDAFRAFYWIGNRAFDKSACAKSTLNFVKACSKPGITGIDTKDSEQSSNNVVFP